MPSQPDAVEFERQLQLWQQLSMSPIATPELELPHDSTNILMTTTAKLELRCRPWEGGGEAGHAGKGHYDDAFLILALLHGQHRPRRGPSLRSGRTSPHHHNLQLELRTTTTTIGAPPYLGSTDRAPPLQIRLPGGGKNRILSSSMRQIR